MKTISVSLYRRPNYTKQVLDALLECANIRDYHIVICCEPPSTRVKQINHDIENTIEIAKGFDHDNKLVVVNKNPLGCSMNIYSSIYNTFANTTTDFHIHFEDDTVPSKDCLIYFEWAKEYYKQDSSVGVVGAYERIGCADSFKPTIEYSEHYISDNRRKSAKRKWFNPWGWGIWRDRWEKNLAEPLYKRIHSPGPYLSWDILTKRTLVDDQNLHQTYPLVSRIQNIGALNGLHCPSEAFHRANQRTTVFASDHNVSETTFEHIGDN